MRILFLLVFCLWSSVSFGQTFTSATANYVLTGCRTYLALIEGGPAEARYAIPMAFCEGSIDAVVSLSDNRLCIPRKVKENQIVRVVIQYLDERPERHHESFALLALEALAAAWPCKQ